MESQMMLAGQDSEESRMAVKLQRELKKKKDALRKSKKVLKSLKPEDAGYAAAKIEEDKVIAEMNAIAEKCPSLAAAVAEAMEEPTKSSAGKKPPAAGASSSASPETAKPATATATSAKGSEGSPKKVEEEAEDLEGNCLKLRKAVEERIKRSLAGPTAVHRRVSVIHPRVAEATVMMEEMLIVGGNARTLAVISAFRDLIKSTTVLVGSSVKDVDTKAFEGLVEANFAFIHRKRAASAGMHYVKQALVSRFVAVRDEVVHHKSSTGALVDALGDSRDVALRIINLIETEVKMSLQSIVEERSLPYTSSSDTILVFGRSSVIEYMLLSRACSPQRKPRRVIVLDAAPLFEGRSLARKLSDAGISVTYGLLTACCTVMPKCTRVFIGASSVLQNGDVFARGGTALVAACAKSFRKPVLCFCESYKFVPEVWLGNLAQNTKLVDIRPRQDPLAETLVSRSPLSFPLVPPVSTKSPSPASQTTPTPFSSNAWPKGDFAAATSSILDSSSAASGYLYDLTPATYVDMIICEMGCLHTSAIVAAIKDREGRETAPMMYLAKD